MLYCIEKLLPQIYDTFYIILNSEIKNIFVFRRNCFGLGLIFAGDKGFFSARVKLLVFISEQAGLGVNFKIVPWRALVVYWPFNRNTAYLTQNVIFYLFLIDWYDENGIKAISTSQIGEKIERSGREKKDAFLQGKKRGGKKKEDSYVRLVY